MTRARARELSPAPRAGAHTGERAPRLVILSPYPRRVRGDAALTYSQYPAKGKRSVREELKVRLRATPEALEDCAFCWPGCFVKGLEAVDAVCPLLAQELSGFDGGQAHWQRAERGSASGSAAAQEGSSPSSPDLYRRCGECGCTWLEHDRSVELNWSYDAGECLSCDCCGAFVEPEEG